MGLPGPSFRGHTGSWEQRHLRSLSASGFLPFHCFLSVLRWLVSLRGRLSCGDLGSDYGLAQTDALGLLSPRQPSITSSIISARVEAIYTEK